MKFEIGYFLIYFLYLISYQMSRVVSRRIRDRLPFLMYTEELKLLTFMHLCCQLKSLYIIQRNYLLDNDSKLYLLYIGGLQAFMSLGKNEMKTHSHRQTSWLLLFLLRKEYHRGIVEHAASGLQLEIWYRNNKAGMLQDTNSYLLLSEQISRVNTWSNIISV